VTLVRDAVEVLERNDTGLFVKPSQRLYPFQWNWDSALIAVGLAHVDPARARAELRSLLLGQWADGMVPHIVFHGPAADYRPGPEVWGSDACAGAPSIPTSGITQPPVLATAVRVLHEAAPDTAFVEEVVPALDAWHAWFHRERSLDGSGLVAVLHPWESADNAPRFDRALTRVNVDGVAPMERSDRKYVQAAERPTDLDYRRYLSLVASLRASGYLPTSLEEAVFAYVDLPLNSILAVAEDDLAGLQALVGVDSRRARSAAERLRGALAGTWDDAAGVYREHDLHGEEDVTGTIADLFPLYAGVPDTEQARRMVDEHLLAPDRFGPSSVAPWPVTTVSKSSPAFDPRNYWRGPVWINVNWFMVRGLERCGFQDEADELRRVTLELVSRSGFSEYYEPTTGEPLGSGEFSWSASLTLDLLRDVRP
jgi:glycogen debranching enzyme